MEKQKKISDFPVGSFIWRNLAKFKICNIIKIMEFTKKQINNLVKKIVRISEKEGVSINKAFVFGSYAKNKVNKYSDLDLCFISPNFKDRIKSSARLRTIIHFSCPEINTPLDIITYNPKDFIKTIPLVHEIKEHGKEIKLGSARK